jgi:undecaprenyl-diphosphatase
MFAVAMLAVTGIVLISLKFAKLRKRTVNLPRALVIGIAQAFALLPGISRSGSTISAARHLGVEPQEAAEFSLLMSVPLLVAATALNLLKLLRTEGAVAVEGMPAGPIWVGAAVAAFVGYFAIAVLVRTLSTGKFWLFGVYCLCMAGVLALMM